MASQVNSQFAYINLINGETVWERLRNVRNFLEDRNVAKKLQKTQEKKRQAILAEIEEATKTSEKLHAEVKLEEFDAHQEQSEDGYKKLDDELEFLIRYEAELAKIAEDSRVIGKTDDEMYQINMESEVVMRNMRKIETERVAAMIGCSLATAEESMRVPLLRQKLINTATAMTLPDGEEKKTFLANGLNFNNLPLTVQEELQLNQKLLLAN